MNRKRRMIATARHHCPELIPVILGADRRLGDTTVYVSTRGWMLAIDRGDPIQLDRGAAPEGVRTWTVKEAMNILEDLGPRDVLHHQDRDRPTTLRSKAKGRSGMAVSLRQVVKDVGYSMSDLEAWGMTPTQVAARLGCSVGLVNAGIEAGYLILNEEGIIEASERGLTWVELLSVLFLLGGGGSMLYFIAPT